MKASLAKHFDARRGTLKLRLEGDERGKDSNDSVELRIDGPDEDVPSRGVEYYDVFINMLVSCVRDQRDSHKLERAVGVVAAAFVYDIPVYRYGDQTGDDKTLVGCLVRGDRVIITNFGTADGAPNILFSTVEGQYRLTII